MGSHGIFVGMFIKAGIIFKQIQSQMILDTDKELCDLNDTTTNA